jgi:hypothetical protein
LLALSWQTILWKPDVLPEQSSVWIAENNVGLYKVLEKRDLSRIIYTLYCHSWIAGHKAALYYLW